MVTMLLHSEELESINSGIQKADILFDKYHVSKKEILDAGVCSRQSFARRDVAVRDGRDVGRNGHPKNLSDTDENILAHWISDLIDQGETVYPWKLIALVCSFLFRFSILLFTVRLNILLLNIHARK